MRLGLVDWAGRRAEILPQLEPEETCQTQPSWQHCALETRDTAFSLSV